MKLIIFPHVSLNELQNVSEATHRICEGIPVLQEELAKVTGIELVFLSGMQKDKNLNTSRQIFDRKRGHCISNLFSAVEIEADYPNNDEDTVNKVAQILAILNKYGKGIKYLKMDHETVAVNNMLQEIEMLDTTAIDGRDFMRWVHILKEKNRIFENISDQKIKRETNNEAISNASAIAPDLIAALEELYAIMYSHLKLTPTEEMQTAYNELQHLLDSI